MSNPYAPPSTQEDVPQAPSNNHTTLRRIGASAMAFLLVKLLWNAFSNFNDVPLGTTITFATMGVLFLGFTIYGFLRKGRKSHLGIATILGLSIASKAYTLWYVAPYREPGPWNPWLLFAIQSIPAIIACICAAALYLRARRTSAAA